MRRAMRLLIGLWLMMAGISWAQVESGRVVGTVHDASQAVIAGATVTVTETQTNVVRTTTTNAAGDFSVSALKPGTYSVTVDCPGFKRIEQPAFKLDVNQVVNLNLVLQIGSASEKVEVTAAEPLVESQTSSIGQVVEEQRVEQLPLNGRDFVQLAYLAPGVNQGPAGTVQQGSIPENMRASGSIQANGLTATNNNFLLDGFDNNEAQIGFEVIQPSVDAIQEFKVQTNNFAADIGKGGAVVNVVLKSGTNNFHGELFEFLRNSAFDAKNYFDSPAFPIPPFKQNQFGGTIGGPIIKNRTFFFFDYQGTRIRQAQTDLSAVPSMAERGGNFSDLLTGVDQPGTSYDQGQIFNPATTKANGDRQTFGGNIIPPGDLDKAAMKLINLFPAPNYPGNYYLSNPVLHNDQDSFDVRVDHQLTQKDSLYSTFDFGNVHAMQPDPFPGYAGGGTFTGNIQDDARAAGITDVHTFAPNKLNEFKIGWTRYTVAAIPFFAGEDLGSQFDLPGIFNPLEATATGGLPNLTISGYQPLGNQDYFPEFLRENTYQLIDSFTYTHGRHSFKFGGDVRRREHGFYQPQNARGDFYFDPTFTEDVGADNGGTPFGGSALASFLLGYPTSVQRDGQVGEFGMSWWEISGYGMDDFRVNSHLTLNLGLRYDVYTPMVEEHNRLANFDFGTGQFITPQMPGVSRSGNVVTDLNNFAPRFGVAWSPWDDKTVFRGGYGIFYDLQANQNDAELAFNPTGLFATYSVNNPPTDTNVRLLAQGLPAQVFPTAQDPSGRASAALFDNRTAYIEEWNVDVERSLFKDAVLQVAYVGTHGVKLARLANLNQPVLPLDSNFSDTTGNYGRPYFDTVPNVGPIRTEMHNAWVVANALEVKFEKRFSSGWSMLNSYTWQHTIGDTEENEWFEPQNTHDLQAERGDNGPDFRHQFTSAISYELPFGHGKKLFGSAGKGDLLIGGWQMNAIISMYSGQALTPMLSYDPTNTGSGAPRPDQIGNPYYFANATSVGCPSNAQSIQCWFNPAAYTVPPLAPGQNFATEFGDAHRGTLRGPAEYNTDLSMFKDFNLRESNVLEFRAEAFNIFNHPEFGLPNQDVDLTGTPGSPGQAGQITSTIHSSRQLQLALKYTF